MHRIIRGGVGSYRVRWDSMEDPRRHAKQIFSTGPWRSFQTTLPTTTQAGMGCPEVGDGRA